MRKMIKAIVTVLIVSSLVSLSLQSPIKSGASSSLVQVLTNPLESYNSKVQHTREKRTLIFRPYFAYLHHEIRRKKVPRQPRPSENELESRWKGWCFTINKVIMCNFKKVEAVINLNGRNVALLLFTPCNPTKNRLKLV